MTLSKSRFSEMPSICLSYNQKNNSPISECKGGDIFEEREGVISRRVSDNTFSFLEDVT